MRKCSQIISCQLKYLVVKRDEHAAQFLIFSCIKKLGFCNEKLILLNS